MEDFVNQIMSTAQRLRDIKFDISDEWVGTLLLAGLPEEYRPMIMGLENSGTPITADAINVKLLQENKSVRPQCLNLDTALVSSYRSSNRSNSSAST
jgi:hypothetical protein